jgi:hypothetical protein
MDDGFDHWPMQFKPTKQGISASLLVSGWWSDSGWESLQQGCDAEKVSPCEIGTETANESPFCDSQFIFGHA